MSEEGKAAAGRECPFHGSWQSVRRLCNQAIRFSICSRISFSSGLNILRVR